MIATMATRLVSPITIGRRTELDAALGVLDAAVEGSVTHLLITGEAGVGKTRLVGELAVAATARGVRVLRGSCASVGDQGLPYGPIVEILAEIARGTEPDELRALVGTSGPDLARLVPALDPSSSAAHVQREFLQARLLDALAGLLRRLSESAPVLVIVEDVHWADPATRETLGFLVRSLRTEPVVVAMTLRSDELHRRHPAMPWISELERTGRVSRIDLARLDADETAAMLASITGEAPSAMVASRFHRRSDGNPFFIEELRAGRRPGRGAPASRRRCRRSSPRGSGRCPSPPDPWWASWPPPVAASITTSSPRPPIAWTSTTSTPPSAMRSRARSWSSTPTPPQAEGYAFRHALLAEVAYDDLLPGERRRLHRACAEALAARPTPTGAPAAAHWAELAHHWAHAHEPVHAFTASLEAAAAAEATYAFEASLHQYERVIDLWTSVPDPEGLAGADQAEILLRAARMAHLAALGGRCVALRREAIAVVGEDEGPVRLAVMHEALGRALWANGDSAESLVEYELAVAAMPAEPPTAERARVLSGYGQMLMLLDRWQESAELCEEAIAIAQLVGAREAEGHARNTLGLDIAAQGRCEEAIASLELALAIAREVGNVDDIGRAHVNLSEAMLFCGFPRDAADAVERGIVEADAIGISGSYGSVIRHNGIQVNFDLGRWETAARLAADSLSSGPVGEINPDRYRISRWVPLIVATGEFDLARTQLDRLGGAARRRARRGPVQRQLPRGGGRARAVGGPAGRRARRDRAGPGAHRRPGMAVVQRPTAPDRGAGRRRRRRAGAVATGPAGRRRGPAAGRGAACGPTRDPRPDARARARPPGGHDDRGGRPRGRRGHAPAGIVGRRRLGRGARELGQGHAPVPRGVRGVARGRGLSRGRRPAPRPRRPCGRPTRRRRTWAHDPCARRSSRWPSGPGSTSPRPPRQAPAPRRPPIPSG